VMLAGTANMLLVFALAGPADSATPTPSRLEQEKSSIEAAVLRWRGQAAAYFNPRKNSFVCQTHASSGDTEVDRLVCAAFVICTNRYGKEFNDLLKMRGDIQAQNAAARHWERTKFDCFKMESELLIRDLALRRVEARRGEGK
jgi:hypothetical protein